jgi:hypothetical protein
MSRRCIILGLGLLLAACGGEMTPEAVPTPDTNRMPLALARPLFQSGYELVGYHELDADGDNVVGVLAVLTLRFPVAESYLGGSRVLLFGQYGDGWSLVGNQQLDGVNARAQLRDLTGDGSPELLVFTEEADTQSGDFVTPLRYTDHLSVFTYTSDLYLVELGAFSSSLTGVMSSRLVVGEWGGRPAIQTMHDLPPVGSPVLWSFQIETFTWDGQDFSNVHTQEKRRLSPIASWLVRRHAPWAALFLALGGVFSVVATTIVHRTHGRTHDQRPRLPLAERWVLLILALLLVAGGVGLSLVREWLCAPALISTGLLGLGVGRWVSMQHFDRKQPQA